MFVQDVFVRYFPWSLVAVLAFIFGCVFLMVPAGEDFYQPPYDRERDLPPEEYAPDADNGDDGDKPSCKVGQLLAPTSIVFSRKEGGALMSFTGDHIADGASGGGALPHHHQGGLLSCREPNPNHKV